MKILFLAGGDTAESDFTLESVKHLATVATKLGWDTAILPTSRASLRTPAWLNQLLSADVAFPLISGLERLCEAFGIPYFGSPPTAAGIAADKGVFNDLPYVRLAADEPIVKVSHLGYPLFVKPSRLGASLGISRVTRREDLASAVLSARSHDPAVVVEAAVSGIEVEVAAIAGREIIVSEPGVVRLPEKYDWHDTESKEFAPMDVPGGLSDDLVRKFKETTIDLVTRLGATCAVRFDYFLTSKNEIYVGEVNCLPGHDKISNYLTQLGAGSFSLKRQLDHFVTPLTEAEPTCYRGLSEGGYTRRRPKK